MIWDAAFFGLRLEVLQLLGALLALAGIYLGMRASAQQRSPQTDR
jgi:drug/metabolite transporter (DMT)-like permease